MPACPAPTGSWSAGPGPRHVPRRRPACGRDAATAPVVYEDFLPRSAAGIFSSNLSEATRVDDQQGGAPYDADRLAAALGRPVHAPQDGYAAQVAASWAEVGEQLGVRLERLDTAVLAR